MDRNGHEYLMSEAHVVWASVLYWW